MKKIRAPRSTSSSNKRSQANSSKNPKQLLRTQKNLSLKSISNLLSRFSLESQTEPEEPLIAHDDIATRAYFIAERREKLGWKSDSATDWSDAHIQLRAEALEKSWRKR